MLCNNCISDKQINSSISYCKNELSSLNKIFKDGIYFIRDNSIEILPFNSLPFKCVEYTPKPKFENRITSLS